MAKVKEELDPVVLETKIKIDNLIEDIKSLEQEEEEVQAIFKAKLEQLTEKKEDRLLSIGNKKEYILQELKQLASQVEFKETKTQRKLDLLNGSIVIKKASTKIDYDKEKLLAWAKENRRNELIKSKTIEDFAWAEFKKNLAVQEGLEGLGVLDTTTGEVVNIDGLSVVETAEEMQIK